jgi:hypothetical protein
VRERVLDELSDHERLVQRPTLVFERRHEPFWVDVEEVSVEREECKGKGA